MLPNTMAMDDDLARGQNDLMLSSYLTIFAWGLYSVLHCRSSWGFQMYNVTILQPLCPSPAQWLIAQDTSSTEKAPVHNTFRRNYMWGKFNNGQLTHPVYLHSQDYKASQVKCQLSKSFSEVLYLTSTRSLHGKRSIPACNKTHCKD